MAGLLCLSLVGCGDRAITQTGFRRDSRPPEIPGDISEVSPPVTIQQLRQYLENYQPQVKILSPQADEVFQDTKVSVQLQVQDLPLFKNSELNLGPHLHVILDNQPYIAVYDLAQPLILPELSPGTHTLRVFASRPWHESFKNEGAYAQTTFHVFTRTQNNNPNPTLPLLTYSRPKGTYGAEPILLDFYLTNAPLHLVAQSSQSDEIPDWRIRCTINGNSFSLNRWEPIYLQGFKPGKNWVQLEFLDEQGNLVENEYNNTVRAIVYEPNGQDPLSRLVRGEISVADARVIVDPNYTAKIPVVPTPTPTPSPTPTPVPTPAPSTEPAPETVPETETSEERAAETETKAEATPTQQRSGEVLERWRRPTITPSPSPPPTLPEIIEPAPATPEPTPSPETANEPEPAIAPTPTLEPTLPQDESSLESSNGVNGEPEEPEPKLDVKEILTP